MDCSELPQTQAKEAIKRTQETGYVHGFIQFADGSTTEVIEGSEAAIDFGDKYDEMVSLLYTRPDNQPFISSANRRLLHRSRLNALCVGVEVEGEQMAFCERARPSCTKTLESPTGEDLSEALKSSDTMLIYAQSPERSVDQPLTFSGQQKTRGDSSGYRPIDVAGVGVQISDLRCPFQ